MIIDDRIYGKIDVTEPVIAEIIQSKPMQRLKAISQDGASHFIQPLRNVTRFEHSVGAWYLSSRFNRPIEEQIASLLHDVPHTAFSHVIDIVMNDEDHEYHDKFTSEIILKSEIPAICAKHGVDVNKVLNKEDYHLLENTLPDISVDRWDYFMRDGFMFGLVPKQVIDLFLASMRERDAQFYFEDEHIASLFAVMYMNCCRLIWLDPSSHGSYALLSQALSRAMDLGIVTVEDFFQTDETVLAMLRDARVPQIDELLARLQPGQDFHYASKDEAEFYGRNKPRTVDPLVLRGEKLVRLSSIVPGLTEYFTEFNQRYQQIGVVQDKIKQPVSD